MNNKELLKTFVFQKAVVVNDLYEFTDTYYRCKLYPEYEVIQHSPDGIHAPKCSLLLDDKRIHISKNVYDLMDTIIEQKGIEAIEEVPAGTQNELFKET